jgi:putative flippase GtrA
LFSPKTKDQQIQSEAGEKLPMAPLYKEARGWKSTFVQFLRYCLVGGLNTIVDIGILNILLWRFPTHNVQALTAYNAVAYSCGAISSFLLNKYWTFRRTQRTTRRELIRFAVSIVLEILYSSALIWLAGRALQPFIANTTLWGNASKLVAVVCGTVLSYSLMRFWTFANGPQR